MHTGCYDIHNIEIKSTDTLIHPKYGHTAVIIQIDHIYYIRDFYEKVSILTPHSSKLWEIKPND